MSSRDKPLGDQEVFYSDSLEVNASDTLGVISSSDDDRIRGNTKEKS